MPDRVFLCVSIDCECDKGPRWRTRRPLTFQGIRVGIAQRLHPLFRHFRAKPTYLLSPEVLRDASSVELLRNLANCELGTHLHGEFAEPGAFEPVVTAAMQRDYSHEVEGAKLAWLTRTFHDALDRRPRTFRAGRFGVGPRTLSFLEELGYEVDSSVTPHVDWSSVSAGLSFIGSPTQPYHPAREDAGRVGDSPLLEAPITIRRGRLAALPWIGKRLGARWLRPTRNDVGELARIALEEMADCRRARPAAPVVLHAMMHNVEVVAGASPYAATDAAATRIANRLGGLLAFAERHGIARVALEDLPGIVAR